MPENTSTSTLSGLTSEEISKVPANQVTLLATALAHIKSPVVSHTVRLLIDTGSQLSFVTEQVVKSLRLPRQQSSVSILRIGGQKALKTKGRVSVTLSSMHKNVSVKIYAYVLRTITDPLPSADVHDIQWPHLSNLHLADPDFRLSRTIDILIGADHYGQIIKPNIIKHTSASPVAQLSIFGWLVLGPVTSTDVQAFKAHQVTTKPENGELHELITRFWVQEEVPSGSRQKNTPEEDECEAHFRATHLRDPQGRYIVRLPLKLPSENLGQSLDIAQRCLQRTVARLQRNNDYKLLYDQFMSEYERLGHMVRAPNHATPCSPHYYLPHHGVLKP